MMENEINTKATTDAEALVAREVKSRNDANLFEQTALKLRMAMLGAASKEELKIKEDGWNALAAMSKSKNKDLANIGKAAAMYQIAVDTPRAAMAAYAALAGIPLVGPGLGLAAAAAVVAYGAERMADVQGAEASFATGTPYVPNDMVANIHKGEAIIPAKYNPFTGNGNTDTNNITVNFYGDIMDTVPDNLAERIEDALYRRQSLAIGGSVS